MTVTKGGRYELFCSRYAGNYTTRDKSVFFGTEEMTQQLGILTALIAPGFGSQYPNDDLA